ncbi:uncharacterized protein LOC134455160 [Engraulis encrasicolus]|uniref:uncharacterized protein LOC134455160 n=1 Tax=Engraulis encrasicolus TaxID=184585 RepID=UPI002FD796FC
MAKQRQAQKRLIKHELETERKSEETERRTDEHKKTSEAESETSIGAVSETAQATVNAEQGAGQAWLQAELERAIQRLEMQNTQPRSSLDIGSAAANKTASDSAKLTANAVRQGVGQAWLEAELDRVRQRQAILKKFEDFRKLKTRTKERTHEEHVKEVVRLREEMVDKLLDFWPQEDNERKQKKTPEMKQDRRESESLGAGAAGQSLCQADERKVDELSRVTAEIKGEAVKEMLAVDECSTEEQQSSSFSTADLEKTTAEVIRQCMEKVHGNYYT